MDATIRNLDEDAYRALKAWAAMNDLGLGEALSRIIRAHVTGPANWPKTASLLDLPHSDWGLGTERVTEEIDSIVYGI